MLSPLLGAGSSILFSTMLMSAMLRSASDSVPVWRARERLGLLRLEFERHGLADHGVLAVFFLRRLIDGEHADVRQDDFGNDDVGRTRAAGVLVAFRKKHVDAVVRQDEAAGAGLRRGFGRHA